MHDFVALDPLHLRGGSKTNRSGRSWKPVKACEATARSLAFGLEATTLCGKGAGGFRTQVWAAPTSVNKTLGGRAVGEENIAVGTHF